ncbi:hypothetical protein COBT_003662 [Conglomerata obtusa]
MHCGCDNKTIWNYYKKYLKDNYRIKVNSAKNNAFIELQILKNGFNEAKISAHFLVNNNGKQIACFSCIKNFKQSKKYLQLTGFLKVIYKLCDGFLFNNPTELLLITKERFPVYRIMQILGEKTHFMLMDTYMD